MIRSLAVAIGLLVVPAMAAAQRDPELRIRVGQEVWISTADGQTIHGAVQGITADDVTIAGGWRAVVLRDDILGIRVRDGIRDGAVLGAVGGGASALFLGPLCDDGHCTAEPVIMLGVVGAGVGALIDALSPRRTIYRRQRVLSVVPIAGRGRAGVVMHWRMPHEW